MSELAYEINGKKSDTRNLPKTIRQIEPHDPYVYEDATGCLIWMDCAGEPHYCNLEKSVGSAVCDLDAKIVRRLGIFKGIAFEATE